MLNISFYSDEFLIADPTLLLDDGSEQRVLCVTKLLIRATDVQLVGFLKQAGRNETGKSLKFSTT